MKKFILILIVTTSCSRIQRQENMLVHTAETKAYSNLHSVTFENINGTIIFEDLKDKIKITTDLSGLPPNSRLGFHIHENGICEGPDYKSAGEHFNPHAKPHGGLKSEMKHLGDLGNLSTNSSGSAKSVIYLPKIQMDELDLILGKSIVIHEKRDDLKTQPSGDSGSRMACGLIRPAN